MAPKKRVSRVARSSANGAEINTEMIPTSGSKRKVRQTGSSSSSSSPSISLTALNEMHIEVDDIMKRLESIMNRRRRLLTSVEENYEDFAFSDSDCEDEEVEQAAAAAAAVDVLNIKENGSCFSSMDGLQQLHLKFDRLIKMIESDHKKQTHLSTFCLSSIPLTVDGIGLKLYSFKELYGLEEKKGIRIFNSMYTFMKKKRSERLGYESDSDSEEIKMLKKMKNIVACQLDYYLKKIREQRWDEWVNLDGK